jgi:hypothetical protein
MCSLTLRQSSPHHGRRQEHLERRCGTRAGTVARLRSSNKQQQLHQALTCSCSTKKLFPDCTAASAAATAAAVAASLLAARAALAASRHLTSSMKEDRQAGRQASHPRFTTPCHLATSCDRILLQITLPGPIRALWDKPRKLWCLLAWFITN